MALEIRDLEELEDPSEGTRAVVIRRWTDGGAYQGGFSKS
jgi:hypothetical protein